MRLQVLGPLQLLVDGEAVAIPGLRRRALLARLAVAHGTTVLVETLIDDIWPHEQPAAARRALNNHVWRLRRHLGPFATRLQRSASGCRLDVEPTELDLLALDVGIADARSALSPDATVEGLEALVGFWRGEALVEFAELPAFAAEIAALGELRAHLVDELVAALLASGRVRAALDAALRAAAAEPLRERTHRLLMSALAADGRSAEAMRAGRAFRRRLTTTTGLDPSGELDELERRVASGALSPGATSIGTVIPVPPLPHRPATALFGRAVELTELGALIETETLITITGPGGVGKTRLGLELVSSAASVRPCAVVGLASIETADSVPLVAAMALGLRPTGGQPPLQLLRELIRDDRWLIVLDNCEHLRLAVRSFVDTLTAACPRLTVVATSRQPLGLGGERLLRLTPLHVPALESGIASVEASSACRLFLERAGRTQPGLRLDADNYVAIADIVRGLDGLPLAIEIAASRMTAFSVHDLHARLDRTLALLHETPSLAAAHHASLRATLDWSYRLLAPDAQQLLCALSLFSDGFTLDAAESIGRGMGLPSDPADALARLVDSSLVEPSLGTGPARYRMLETVRTFGLTVLDETGQRPAAERANRSWITSLVESIACRFGGPDEPSAVDALLSEHLNLHAAHERARASDDADTRRRIIVGLFPFVTFCEIPDILTWELQAVSDFPGGHRDVELLAVSSIAALARGRPDLAETRARRSLELAPLDSPHPFALDALGTAAMYAGRLEEAIEHFAPRRHRHPLARVAIDVPLHGRPGRRLRRRQRPSGPPQPTGGPARRRLWLALRPRHERLRHRRTHQHPRHDDTDRRLRTSHRPRPHRPRGLPRRYRPSRSRLRPARRRPKRRCAAHLPHPHRALDAHRLMDSTMDDAAQRRRSARRRRRPPHPDHPAHRRRARSGGLGPVRRRKQADARDHGRMRAAADPAPDQRDHRQCGGGDRARDRDPCPHRDRQCCRGPRHRPSDPRTACPTRIAPSQGQTTRHRGFAVDERRVNFTLSSPRRRRDHAFEGMSVNGWGPLGSTASWCVVPQRAGLALWLATPGQPRAPHVAVGWIPAPLAPPDCEAERADTVEVKATRPSVTG